MRELYLGWEKVSCLEMCPHFRGGNACKNILGAGKGVV